MKKLTYGLLFSLSLTITLLFSSCGEQHQAKQLVKTFLKENLKDNQFSIEQTSKLDSTYLVSDSTLQVLRTHMAHSPIFKPLNLNNAVRSKKLLYMQVKYVSGTKEYDQTFYMDDKLEHVVAFKENQQIPIN